MGWRLVGYVLTKLTRPITRLWERDLRRREEKGKVGEVNKRCNRPKIVENRFKLFNSCSHRQIWYKYGMSLSQFIIFYALLS